MSKLNNNRNFKEELIEQLLETQGASRPGYDDICIRCPICGDSIKSRDHGHFHVRINPDNNDEPIYYHCFRCSSSGIFTPSLLRDIGVYDQDICTPLVKYNKVVTKKIKNTLGIKENGLEISIPIPQLIDLAERKRRYLNWRLGVNLSFEEWVELKVVFNLVELLMYNKIQQFTTNKDMIKTLHNDYVGFLTTKNEFINFRDITGKKENKRYYKYAVMRSLEDTRNMYIVPNKVDLLTTEPLEINICEGVFDAVSVYLNINNRESKNKIHVAVCGSGFFNVCKYFIHLGLFGDHVTINIYSDKDRNEKFYRKLFDKLRPLVGHINLIYNDLEKDCGVPKERIKLIRKRIK